MQNINVNIVPDSYPQTIRYSQGDVGREFKINVVGFTIPTGATVKIQATKPSGFGFSVAGTVDGNAVSFTTTAVMTDEAGRFPAELEITKDSVVIGTANFIMWGEANPHPEGTTDGQQGTIIPELTLLVERVEAAASSVLDMEVVANTLPAGSQATYSYDEDLNKATFGIPQGEAGAGAAGVVASAYSASATYKVGDYVIHNSNLYRCTTAITTAEAFTAAHWTQIVLANDVSDLKTDLNSLRASASWIDVMDANYINLSNDQKKYLNLIPQIKATMLFGAKQVSIYNLVANANGSISFSIIITWHNDNIDTTSFTLPASESLAEYSLTKYNLGISVDAVYSTLNYTGVIIPSSTPIKLNYAQSGSPFVSETVKFDGRIIKDVKVSENVSTITINRMENCDLSYGSSTYYYYNSYTVSYKDGSSATLLSRDKTAVKSGIVFDSFDDFIVVVDADLLGEYNGQYYNISINVILDVADIIPSFGRSIKNNMVSDGNYNMRDFLMYKNGIASLLNYGQDDVRYVLEKNKKDLTHIRFDFQFTKPLPYYDNAFYYTLVSVFGSKLVLDLFPRKVTIAGNEPYMRTVFRLNNPPSAITFFTPTNNDYKSFSGETAFSVRYMGNTANDVVMVTTDSNINILVNNNSVASISYNSNDSVDSLVDALNGISDITAKAINTNGHKCSELIITRSVEIPLVSTYSSTKDNPIVYIDYMLDSQWHTVEVIADPYNNKGAIAIDGMTAEGDLTLTDTDNDIIIGGLASSGGTETPIRVRNLEIDFGTLGDAELITGYMPLSPYSEYSQIISNKNPRIIIFEGHGIIDGRDADITNPDEMSVTTERLQNVFNILESKGYKPISFSDLIDWKCNGKAIPKRSYCIMMDDYRLENYMGYRNRIPFAKHNVKVGLAMISNRYALDDDYTVDGVTYKVAQIIDAINENGWYMCSHTADHRHINSDLPSNLDENLESDALSCDIHKMHSDILVYPYGDYSAEVVTALKHSAFKLGISIVENRYNCRATSDFALTRIEIGTRESLENIIKQII